MQPQTLLSEVARYIRREKLLQPREPVWVAVSGGADSMVLLHVLRALGHACSVAHVDHGLRGTESDGDRDFVKAHCEKEGLSFRTIKVDPQDHAEAFGLSTQMAGRALRYEWLGELWKEQPWPIAIAHHADDAVETLILHLLRGTGVAGWSAISPRSGIFVRPLLGVDRTAILAYAQENSIAFREDSSNADPKYLRNRVRHEVLPLLEKLRPGAMGAMARSLAVLRELEEAGQQVSMAGLSGVRPSADGIVHVPFAAIEGSRVPLLLLYRAFRHLGFHPHQLERMRDAMIERSTGALFQAGPWRVSVDREVFVLSAAEAGEPPAFVIDPGTSSRPAGPFRWHLSDERPEEPPRGMSEVLLDADRLSFPLEIRPWRAGDRMRPIGLGGSKLVSDILIDAKVSRPEKEHTYVLVNGEEIVWLVGHRLAEGFQAREGTTLFLRIEAAG